MKSRSTLAVFIASGVAMMACSSSAPSASESTGSSAQAINTVNVFHSTQNGGNANGSVSYYDVDTQSYYQLQFQAWENKSAKSRTSSLSFYGYGYSSTQVCYDEQICEAWDYNTWTCTAWETMQYCYEQQVPYWISGYGDIPTSDFRVGPHTAHLTTDLANDPSFYATRCGYDSSWNYSCTPVTGRFDVSWRDNGSFSTEQQGMWKSTSTSPWGSFSMQSTGHASNATADVTGTALGDVVSSGGNLGLSMGASVSKDVFQGTPSGDGGMPPPPPPPYGDGG
jgi:hypothetical protein